MTRTIKRISLLFSFIVVGSNAHAIEYTLNGFMTIAAGQMIKREKNNPDYLDYNCPCYITDYNQGGLYEGGEASLLPDSKIGLQSSMLFTPDLSFTLQGIARAVDAEFSLEWAYLSYRLSGNWTLQAGRKRLPIYYYSDFQDVGNTYILARPQQALYGWEVSNYNGISLLYEYTWGDWDINGSIYTGEDEVSNSGYKSLYNTVPQDVKWENIIGTYLSVNREWFNARLTYIESDNFITDNPFSSAYYSPPTQQSIIGLALNANFESWFILSEFNENQRTNKSYGLDVKAPAISIGVGYRHDQFTYFINHSSYTDKTSDITVYEPERWSDTSVTLRYDFDTSSDIKVQVDRFRENAYYDFVGDTTLLTIAYDIVF